MSARPTVSVYQSDDASQIVTSVPLPAVFTAPIRPDVVGFVHTNIAKNKRQGYAVARNAGEQTAAESWGTGRAVARIPRVPGGGTHRAGQGAFGNMCRGGRMFAPNRIWRKWHRIVNQNQRRYAVASALAATAVPPLVMARGHRISNIPEVPLVLGGSINTVQKTKEAYKLLQKVGAAEDVDKCKDSKQLRIGSGKMRNRRYTMRRGPLIVYDGPSSSRESTLYKAFRNLPGVELAHVERLNLLQLAPGGHMGRFVIWTQGAFEKLDSIYGTQDKKSEKKVDYSLPRAIISNPDLGRVINSDEIQSVVRPAKSQSQIVLRKKNPLRNLGVLVKLNPYALAHRRAEIRNQLAREQKKEKTAKAKREQNARKQRTAFLASMLSD